MKRLSEEVKLDVGLVPQALNNNSVTGRYYPMGLFSAALAKLSIGAMSAGDTASVQFLQAQDAAGTGAKGIPTTPGQEAIATLTANVLATVVAVTVGLPNVGDTLTVNGIVFTVAAATDVTKREFADAAGLEACINDAARGVPGVRAVNAAGVVTLDSLVAGDTVITVVQTGAALVPATVQSQAYVDLLREQLDRANGFGHIAIRVTTDANTVVSAELMRSRGRYPITQRVGASALVS